MMYTERRPVSMFEFWWYKPNFFKPMRRRIGK